MGLSPRPWPSPNHGPRRGGAVADMVVLHYTAMASAAAALARLSDPEAAVSAHYLIEEDGTLWQLVPEAARAWHAGAGAWGGARDVNSRSIGIELANAGPAADLPPFSAPQMAMLERLLADLLARHRIAPARVIGHACMAPGRKADPGPKFDWRRLARRGLAVWPDGVAAASGDPGGEPAAAFRRAARLFGYVPPAGPDGWDQVLAAFRDRFRPGADGPLDATDAAMLGALAAAHPCIDAPADPI